MLYDVLQIHCHQITGCLLHRKAMYTIYKYSFLKTNNIILIFMCHCFICFLTTLKHIWSSFQDKIYTKFLIGEQRSTDMIHDYPMNKCVYEITEVTCFNFNKQYGNFLFFPQYTYSWLLQTLIKHIDAL